MGQRVWVSTIHKAKGKEWRCVILPALGEGLCPAEMRGEVPGTVEEPDGVEQSPWIEQERRIFYVGLTRASERAYVEALPPTPSRFLSEIRPPPSPPVRPQTKGSAASPASPASACIPLPSAHGKAWSEAEQQTLVGAWEGGADLITIAALLGRSVSAVAYCVVRIGLAADLNEAGQHGSTK